MKRLFFIASVWLVLGVSLSWGDWDDIEKIPVSKWVQYKNDEFGFSFRYPPTFKIQEESKEGKFNLSFSSGGAFSEYLTIWFSMGSQDGASLGWYGRFNGQKGMWMKYDDENIPLCNDVTHLSKDVFGYGGGNNMVGYSNVIVLGSDGKSYEWGESISGPFWPTFAKMLKTFQFTKHQKAVRAKCPPHMP